MVSKRKIVAIVLCVLITIYCLITASNFARYTYEKGLPCSRKPEDLRLLSSAVHIVDDVLNELAVPHYLIYGSLIGALRYSGPLPWDYDADVGLDGDAFVRLSQKEIQNAFQRRGARYVNLLFTNGRSIVFYGDEHVDLMPFYNYWRDGWMRRRGLDSWATFINYRLYYTFPAHLVQLPLDRLMFGGRNVTVPRGGTDILRYWYPSDWYKEVMPKGC